MWEYNGKSEVYAQVNGRREIIKVPHEVGALIAAAPELYEWALSTLTVLDHRDERHPAFEELRLVLARAEKGAHRASH
jgi:hypothetical protein